jgi:prevent-host-death family protein
MEVTVQEAKTHLSRLLRKVEAGESIVIRRGSQRIAVLSPAPPPSGERRIWGDVRGQISDDFDNIPADFTPYQ